MPGSRVTLDEQRFAELEKTHYNIIKTVKYMTDKEQYNKLEEWTDCSTGKGDCEDFALQFRQDLEALGWPEDCMGRATCFTEDNEFHCVLLVNTDKGTYVLDNRFKTVMAWKDCNYRWDYVPRYLKESIA